MWPFDLAHNLAAMTADRDALAARCRKQDLAIRQLEAWRAGLPNEGMSADEAWAAYHAIVEREAWEMHTRGTEDQGDDRMVIPVWVMKGLFVFVWDLKR